MTNNSYQDFLTVQQAAMILQLSTDKVYELAKTPGFPSFTIGRTIRIIKDKLPEWAASQAGGEERASY